MYLVYKNKYVGIHTNWQIFCGHLVGYSGSPEARPLWIKHTWLNPLGRSYCNTFNVSQCSCGPVSYMYMLPIVGSVRETAENENCYQADVLRPTCRVVGKIATIVISGVHLSSELSYLQPTSYSFHGTTCTTRAGQCGVSCQPLLYCGHNIEINMH